MGDSWRINRTSRDDLRLTSGRFQVLTDKWEVSEEGGTRPRWRRDCKELYYVAPDGRFLMAVPVAETAAPTPISIVVLV